MSGKISIEGVEPSKSQNYFDWFFGSGPAASQIPEEDFQPGLSGRGKRKHVGPHRLFLLGPKTLRLTPVEEKTSSDYA
jgi:hypothetical protein